MIRAGDTTSGVLSDALDVDSLLVVRSPRSLSEVYCLNRSASLDLVAAAAVAIALHYRVVELLSLHSIIAKVR